MAVRSLLSLLLAAALCCAPALAFDFPDEPIDPAAYRHPAVLWTLPVSTDRTGSLHLEGENVVFTPSERGVLLDYDEEGNPLGPSSRPRGDDLLIIDPRGKVVARQPDVDMAALTDPDAELLRADGVTYVLEELAAVEPDESSHYRLSAWSSGSQQWSHDLGDDSARMVLGDAAGIYVCTSGHYELSPGSDVIRRYNAQGLIGRFSCPVFDPQLKALPDGGVLSLEENHTLACWEPDGALRWRYTLDAKSEESELTVTVAPDRLYVGVLAEPTVYALRLDGRELWRRSLPLDSVIAGITGPVLLGRDGNVHVPCNGDQVHTLDADGYLLWERHYVMPGVTDPQGNIFALELDAGRTFTTDQVELHSFSPSGEIQGMAQGLGQLFIWDPQLIAARDRVYLLTIMDRQVTLLAIDPHKLTEPWPYLQQPGALVHFRNSPRELWRIDLSQLESTADQPDGVPEAAKFFYTATAKQLLAVDNGFVRWRWQPEGEAKIDSFTEAPDGALYVLSHYRTPVEEGYREVNIISRLEGGQAVWSRDFGALIEQARQGELEGTIYVYTTHLSADAHNVYLATMDGATVLGHDGTLKGYLSDPRPNAAEHSVKGLSPAPDGVWLACGDGLARYSFDAELLELLPVVADGPAITGPEGTLYSFDGFQGLRRFDLTGKQEWLYVHDWVTVADNPTGYYSRSSADLDWPAVAPDGSAYIGTLDGQLICVGPDGRQRWQRAIGGSVAAPVLGPDGTVYAASSSNSVSAFTADGTLIWEERGLGFIQGAPRLAPDGSALYVQTAAALIALRP
jgi:outer membrane protein assembly factor BamB